MNSKTSKETPLKPIYNPRTEVCQCAACKRVLKISKRTAEWAYCPRCGQRIGWDDVDDDIEKNERNNDDPFTYSTTFYITPEGELGFKEEPAWDTNQKYLRIL